MVVVARAVVVLFGVLGWGEVLVFNEHAGM